MKFKFHNKTDISHSNHNIVITTGENHNVVHFFHNGEKYFHNVVITTIFMKFVPGEGPTRAPAPRASGSAVSVRKYMRRAIIKYCFPNTSFLKLKNPSLHRLRLLHQRELHLLHQQRPRGGELPGAPKKKICERAGSHYS